MKEKIQKILKQELSKKQKMILSISIAVWGVILIGSGMILNAQNRTITKTIYSLDVNQKRVAQQRTNEIKLKNLEIEINTPLSVDVKDYLEDVENLDESIYDYLKLDTSTVKISEAGEYTYTITYRKKKYNGTIKVKEKALPNVVLQLKNLKLEKDKPIPTDKTAYINTPLTEEMINNITLDIHNIKNNEVGVYQYTIIYNNTNYVGTVEVYNPTPVITPGDKTNITTTNKTKDDNQSLE